MPEYTAVRDDEVFIRQRVERIYTDRVQQQQAASAAVVAQQQAASSSSNQLFRDICCSYCCTAVAAGVLRTQCILLYTMHPQHAQQSEVASPCTAQVQQSYKVQVLFLSP